MNRSKKPADFKEKVSRTHTYINNMLDENVLLKDVASNACTSLYHFHRKLSKELNTPVGKFIRHKKLEHASALLVCTNLPISEIKYWAGYTSDAAFSKAFKKRFGLPPSSFKEDRYFKHPEQIPQGFNLHFEKVSLTIPCVKSHTCTANYFDPSHVDIGVADFLGEDQPGNLWGIYHECPLISGSNMCRFTMVQSKNNSALLIPGTLGSYAKFKVNGAIVDWGIWSHAVCSLLFSKYGTNMPDYRVFINYQNSISEMILTGTFNADIYFSIPKGS